MQNKTKRSLRRFVLIVFLMAAAVWAVWGSISPLLTSGSETVYESYCVERGNITTFKSFSANLEVLNSETHANERQVGLVRKLYVQSGQQVQKGDKLLQLDSGTIYRSGINGTVNEMRFGEGDWVWPNVQLIQICDLENLQVTLRVDEYDIDKVSAGEKCTVTIVALGLDFETEIAHVNRLSSATGSVAYYDVTAELTVPENVLPGMTASVSIPAEEALDVLMLDMAALAFDENRTPYVYVKNADAYEKRELEIGLHDGMKAEVLSGLGEGEMVYAAREQKTEVKPFSLSKLYKRIVGEKVVINVIDGGRRNDAAPRNGFPFPPGGELPEGMNPFPGETDGRNSDTLPSGQQQADSRRDQTQPSGGDAQ